MIQVKSFVFNLFYENTYVLYDETGECIIIDPGCSHEAEQQELADFIASHQLKPVKLVNTHCHIDHILGNSFAAETWGLALEAHENESYNVSKADAFAAMFGIDMPNPLPIARFIDEGQTIQFGNTTLEILFTPGHSPGHIVFYHPGQKIIIGGDVLFRESIGRTDLPGGDFDTLIRSIKNKLFTLAGDITVYPGHGPETTIGHEMQYNPFLQEVMS